MWEYIAGSLAVAYVMNKMGHTAKTASQIATSNDPNAIASAYTQATVAPVTAPAPLTAAQIVTNTAAKTSAQQAIATLQGSITGLQNNVTAAQLKVNDTLPLDLSNRSSPPDLFKPILLTHHPLHPNTPL